MLKKLPNIWGFRFLLNSRRIYVLILKCLLLLAIPEAYLMLCGLVFDQMLHWYFMTNFIFISLVVIFVLAMATIIWACIRYFKQTKRGGRDGKDKKQERVKEHQHSI